MPKLYSTYDPDDIAGTLSFYDKKAEAEQAAKNDGLQFEQHDVELKRAPLVEWLNGTVLRRVASGGAPKQQPEPQNLDPTIGGEDRPQTTEFDPVPGMENPAPEQPDVAHDNEGDLERPEDMEPAGEHDDPEPPSTADEAIDAHHQRTKQVSDDIHQKLDEQGVGERPPEAQEEPADNLGDWL